MSLKATSVAYGAHGGDHAIYPDCRPAFAEALDRAIRLADLLAMRDGLDFSEVYSVDQPSHVVDMLFGPNEHTPGSGGLVTFTPGARTAWHAHPVGQTLIVTSGLGWIQAWGEERREIKPGDVIWIPPNVKHWHGASDTNAMSHIALQEVRNGSAAEWMEQVNLGFIDRLRCHFPSPHLVQLRFSYL